MYGSCAFVSLPVDGGCDAGVVLGAGLAGGIGSMLGVFLTPPENTVQKHLFWLVNIAFCFSDRIAV
jgi:hypothetical protein